MELSLLGATRPSVDLLTVLSNPAFWAVTAAVIGAVAGSIAFVTALINRRTAVAAREVQLAELRLTDGESEPGILLPARLQYFVDRAAALEQAVAQISAGERVLAIEGSTGVGKSAVATELVHRLRSEDTEGIPDLGAHDYLWIDGDDGCLTLVEICHQVTLVTGDQSVSSVADDAKLHALRAHLAGNKTVLLLDNIKFPSDSSVDPLRALLRTVPSGSLVIAAVNSPYALDASRVVLQELEPRYVLELVQHEARRLGLGDPNLFDEAFAGRLQGAVGGNPRLIETFLRAVSRSPASLEKLLEAVERGEGLRELFLPVWAELSARSRWVLGACAYLRGQAVADQLAVACEIDREDLSRVLAELMQVGFLTVVRSGGRPEVYVCPYSVQRFAIGETQADAIAAFTGRLTAYYIRQFAREPENAQWAIPHIAGIKAVLQWLSDRGDDADAQGLFASILDIFFTLGLFDDRITTGRLAYESAMRAGNHRSASLATDVLASTHAARGELEEAREAVALGLLAAERSDDPGERARQMRANAVLLYKSGEAVRAITAMDGADELARETGELEILVNILGLRTVAHWYVGAFAEAEAAAESGLRVCREMSWQRATAYPLRNLAEVAIHRGDLDRARMLVEQAGKIAAAFGDRRQMARIRLTTARLELVSRNVRAARSEAFSAESDAIELGLAPELQEARAIRVAAARAGLFPPVGRYYARRRPPRFTDAPVGGD
jgi:hypothetical protein